MIRHEEKWKLADRMYQLGKKRVLIELLGRLKIDSRADLKVWAKSIVEKMNEFN